MEYVEERNQGLYLTGTRVSLASVIQEFRNGAAPESILRSFPMIGSLELVYGAITYCLAHPSEVDHYLGEQAKLWQEGRAQSAPLPDELRQRIAEARQTAQRPR